MSELNFDLLEELKVIKEKFEQLDKRKSELSEKHSQLDKKIEDIMHCAEFYELDACKGYKLYKILHQTRIERRIVTNELKAIGETLSRLSISNIKGAIKETENAFSKDKIYTPRVVDELFDLLK